MFQKTLYTYVYVYATKIYTCGVVFAANSSIDIDRSVLISTSFNSNVTPLCLFSPLVWVICVFHGILPVHYFWFLYKYYYRSNCYYGNDGATFGNKIQCWCRGSAYVSERLHYRVTRLLSFRWVIWLQILVHVFFDDANLKMQKCTECRQYAEVYKLFIVRITYSLQYLSGKTNSNLGDISSVVITNICLHEKNCKWNLLTEP